MFVSGILSIAHFGGDNLLLVAVCVGLLVWAVGMGMGGMTGFAMNQARDLGGPAWHHQLLPIKGKVDNNWRYGLLVPGIAPFVGPPAPRSFVHGFLGIFLGEGRGRKAVRIIRRGVHRASPPLRAAGPSLHVKLNSASRETPRRAAYAIFLRGNL